MYRKLFGTLGQGVMPDGTTRFKDKDGNPIYHFMGKMKQYVNVMNFDIFSLSPDS